jgi:hypothetical protein
MRGQVLSWCVAVSLLAGCGSSKAVSTGSPASRTATTAAPTVTTAGTATTKATAAAPTSSVAAGAEPKLTGAADNDFCHYLVDLGKKATLDDPPVEGQSSDQLKQATNEAQTLYNEMAKRAPTEIKPDMSALAANFNRLAAIYASVGYDTVKLQQQMSDPASAVAVEFGKLGTTDSAGSGERVDAYIQNVCGLKG